MRLWVTRTSPDNRASAARLEAMGHDVLLAPVLDVRAVSSKPRRFNPDAIIFTSLNGVRHHPVAPGDFDIPVFTVGDRTAEAARTAGYRNVRSADGDVRDLQHLIVTTFPPSSRMLHYRARDVAGNIPRFLRRFGLLVEERVVYASQAVPLRWLLRMRKQLDSVDGILVHSPRAAERLSRVLVGTGWSGSIWCISEACALRLAHLPRVTLHFAASPTEAAMLQMIHQRTAPPTRTLICDSTARYFRASGRMGRDAANENVRDQIGIDGVRPSEAQPAPVV